VFLDKIVEKRSQSLSLQHPRNNSLSRYFGIGGANDAGVTVSPDSGYKVPAAWACINVISQTIASLPLKTYKILGEDDRKEAKASPIYKLLHDKPNSWQTSYEWRMMMMAMVLTHGNAYSQIIYDNSGRPVALEPFPAGYVNPFWAPDGERAYYTSRKQDGSFNILLKDEILHFMGVPNHDGLCGLSPIESCANAMGITIAAESFGARFFANGSQLSGVLSHPEALSDKARDNLRTSWEKRYQGSANSHKTAVLEEGVTFTPLTIPPDQAQFLETRKFQRSEIASIYRVPPHMIGDLERSTNNNIEHQSLEFIKYTMRPWFVSWEQQLETKLLSPRQQTDMFIEFDADAMLRGDMQSRYQAYSIARNWGWMSSNDIRRIENMNKLDAEKGDVYLQPLNMVPAGTEITPKDKNITMSDSDTENEGDDEPEA
jgi:HK97 family phage portal protein